MKNEGVVMSLPLMSQVNAAASDRMHAERDAGRSALARRLRWRALFYVFYDEVPAVELHGLPGSGTLDCFEDRRHRGNAHELTPLTGELAR